MSIIDKVKSIAARRVARTLVVKSAINVTPNMRRVTLCGDDLAGFPAHSEGAYIKLMFNLPDSEKPTMRTYTVSQQRYQPDEIDVDFMLHASSEGTIDGVAAPWALQVQCGDKIEVGGPGPAKFINTEADCFLLAADMTALPALTENLKRLPLNAQGEVFIEILTDADQQALTKPEKVNIHWVVNESSGSEVSPLFQALAKTAKPNGKLSAWVACEFKTMKKIRLYLKNELAVEKSHLYISSYWKKGNTEEQHKVVKRADAETAII